MRTSHTMMTGRRHWLSIPIVLMSLLSTGYSQLRISGQASSAFIKANDGISQYAVNNGRPTFAWRLDLFADVVVSDNIFLMSNVRVHQDQILRLDLFALKLTDVASTGFNIEMGEIELPFGNLGERRFPKSNSFYNLPLMNEHLTRLSDDAVARLDDPRYSGAGNVHILDQGLYDLGVKVYGGAGMFDFGIAVVNGMVSATSTYSSYYGVSGLNPKGGFGTIVRLAATPFTGMTLGSSFATGPFAKGVIISGSGIHNASDVPEHAVEADVGFSIDHFALYGQAVYTAWRFAELWGSDLQAIGYTIEGRYTPMPRMTLAARAGGLNFNEVSLDRYALSSVEPYIGKWDQDVFRLEGAVGYRLDRAVALKVVYQWNKTLDVPIDPVDNVFVFQTVVSF